jgi:hypothetical protein
MSFDSVTVRQLFRVAYAGVLLRNNQVVHANSVRRFLGESSY